MTNEIQTAAPEHKKKSLQSLISDIKVKSRFEEILGKRAPAFISSIISAVRSNPALEKCDPMSIVAAASIAAALDLPINGNLGSCAMVPYRTKNGESMAQFQIMRTGWVQLAQRTGQYSLINATEVYEGQLIKNNTLTGEIVFDSEAKTSDKVIGYAAYFKLVNGFEKTVYMTVEDCLNHGKKYSKSFNNEAGLWKTNPGAMCLKTVLKRAISKWGPVSIDSQLSQALIYDQAGVKDNGEPDYFDGVKSEIKEEEIPMPKAKTQAIAAEKIAEEAETQESEPEPDCKCMHTLMAHGVSGKCEMEKCKCPAYSAQEEKV